MEILLVDDDDEDVRLTRRALDEPTLRGSIHRVEDGVVAMQFLRREADFVQAVRPDLVLLDLNMPRMDGRQVLQEMKADEALASIPVIVFTNSQDEVDVLSCYQSQANSYIVKPLDLHSSRELLGYVRNYWFGAVSLP